MWEFVSMREMHHLHSSPSFLVEGFLSTACNAVYIYIHIYTHTPTHTHFYILVNSETGQALDRLELYVGAVPETPVV